MITKVSIIIPTYNHLEDCLRPCIESIIKYTDLSDVEVIIVANGCKDKTREYVESLGEHFKLVWFDKGQGYTKATNEGVKKSKGEILILMNNDFLLLDQPKNQWIDFLIKPLKDNIGITGNLKLWDWSVERKFILFFCAAIPRYIWDKIGGLNEEWSPGGGEDIEFCLKVEQLGYKVIQVPDEENIIKDGINVNHFMSYHAGEATVMDEEHKGMWVKHIEKVREKLEYKYKLPEGWFYEGDIGEYRRLVEDVPTGGTICELGCFKGRSICSVADIIKRKKLKVYVVDTFKGTVNEGMGNMDFLKDFKDNCKRFEIKAKITKDTTNNAVGKFRDKMFNLLFIDADHSYDALRQDLENWECKVKKGGTIAGHDYGNQDGIGKAVNEKYFNIRLGGSVWSKRL